MSILGQWKLKRVDADQIGGDTVLTFEEDRVSYRYGNNHFHNFTVNGANITIGPGASTRMFVEINPPEHTVSDAIHSSNQWRIDGNTLILSQDGKQRVTLQRV